MSRSHSMFLHGSSWDGGEGGGGGGKLDLYCTLHAVSPCDLKDEVDLSVVSRLEAAGYPLLHSLENHFDEFKEIVGIGQDSNYPKGYSPESSVEIALDYWTCWTPVKNPRGLCWIYWRS